MEQNKENLSQIERMANTALCELELDYVPCELEDWFEEAVLTSGCRIVKKVWRSLYNNYVSYDYEPFTTRGFKLRFTLVASDPSYLDFFKFIYDKRIKALELLNNMAKAN